MRTVRRRAGRLCWYGRTSGANTRHDCAKDAGSQPYGTALEAIGKMSLTQLGPTVRRIPQCPSFTVTYCAAILSIALLIASASPESLHKHGSSLHHYYHPTVRPSSHILSPCSAECLSNPVESRGAAHLGNQAVLSFVPDLRQPHNKVRCQ